jgi:formylglycine-generating enzyme required for sulfatase activity
MNLHARIKFYSFLVVAALVLICQPASATKRVALVIGNSHYKNAALLANPANDAAAIAATLKNAGFDAVDSRLDLQSTDMRRALRDFADQVRDADIAVVYYAGHGIEIGGTNYLIPTDAQLERDSDVYDEAFSLDRVLSAIEPAKQLRLVIVDACRNNPFADTMKRTVSSRATSRGLARIEPTTSNTLVAFAAKAGLTALDGTNKTSPYAEALVKHIATPGLDLRRAFGFVRDEVLRATGNRQEPYVYGSLGGEDFALVPAPKPAALTPAASPEADIRRDYELAAQVGNRAAMNAFLGQHPDGFYASLANLQLEKIEAEEATAAAAERARLAEQQRARLAAEGAKREMQAKADAEAKAAEAARAAAEDARIAIEKAKVEKIKVEKAEAEQLRAEKLKAEQLKAEQSKSAEAAEAAEVARLTAALRPRPAERLAAAVVGDSGPDKDRKRDEPRSSQGCSGAQVAALSSNAAIGLSPPEECGLRPKDVFRECVNCPEMVVVPAGEVLMGSTAGDIDSGLAAANEAPQHRAVVKQSIAVGRFEVTRDQYAAFVKSAGYRPGERCYTFEHNLPQLRAERSYLNPGFVQDGHHPAVCVSWTDAKAYVQWLSQTTGKPYRLLSEAEFEYAARAGSTSRFGFGDDPSELCKFANGADRTAKSAGLPADTAYMNCSDGHPFTAPVGSLAANAFGLSDMIGNVWEWTEDCFGDYATAGSDSAARVDAGCTSHTLRGGDWFSTETSLRPAVRAKANADARHDDIGFRVARTLGP